MNNKGFMMAEVIVVASIIMLSLTGFYVIYTKTISVYNDRISYYDVATLYKLANYRDNNNFGFDNDTEPYKQLAKVDPDGFNVFLLKKLTSAQELLDKENINKTFQEYLDYLMSSTKLKYGEDDHVLIMEKCDEDGKTNCKYAYLETAVK